MQIFIFIKHPIGAYEKYSTRQLKCDIIFYSFQTKEKKKKLENFIIIFLDPLTDLHLVEYVCVCVCGNVLLLIFSVSCAQNNLLLRVFINNSLLVNEKKKTFSNKSFKKNGN